MRHRQWTASHQGVNAFDVLNGPVRLNYVISVTTCVHLWRRDRETYDEPVVPPAKPFTGAQSINLHARPMQLPIGLDDNLDRPDVRKRAQQPNGCVFTLAIKRHRLPLVG